MSARWYLIIGFLGLVVDQIVKRLAMTSPPWYRGVFIIIDDVFGFGGRLNREFAWGLPVSNGVTAVIMTTVLVGLVAYALFRPRLFASPLVFILAGAVSNLIDRLVWGGAIDYVLLPFDGAVNLADGMIVLGLILLLFRN